MAQTATRTAIQIDHKPRIRPATNPGIYYVESRTRGGLTHMCNTRTLHCTCEAGKHGLRCWHLTLCIPYDDFRRRQELSH